MIITFEYELSMYATEFSMLYNHVFVLLLINLSQLSLESPLELAVQTHFSHTETLVLITQNVTHLDMSYQLTLCQCRTHSYFLSLSEYVFHP